MSLVALDGTPLVPMGTFMQPGLQGAWAVSSSTIDAVNEAIIMYGRVITDDGASHTIDATGSSAMEWRSAAVTFASASSTVKVGLATMDAATGPPARATNATDVITYSVSKSHTGGGGGITANAWQTNVPDTGTLAVASGDLIAFAVQMTARGGADAVNVSTSSAGIAQFPGVTAYLGATYAAAGTVPICFITFSDGHTGWFFGGTMMSTITAQTWNSGSATKEYGNYLQFPFPMKVYGIYAQAAIGGDCDFILYSAPLGTPVAEKTASQDANILAAATVRPGTFMFSSPYTTTANQPLAAIMKPTTVTDITSTYRSFSAAAHQVTDECGTNGYAVSRASGAFAAVNSSKDRFPIGLLVGAFDTGGSSGISRARAAGGF